MEKKAFKKGFAFLLAMMMVFTIAPATLFAQETTQAAESLVSKGSLSDEAVWEQDIALQKNAIPEDEVTLEPVGKGEIPEDDGLIILEGPKEITAQPGKLFNGGASLSGAVALTLGTKVSGNITNNDSQWYKFTTTNNNSFYRFTLKNVSLNGSIYARLCDSSDKTIKSVYVNNGESKYKSPKLSKNTTYYIEIDGDYNKTGNFELTVKEFKDDAGDTKSGSASISLNKTYTKSINVEEDVDWYKFTTTNTSSFYRVRLENVNLDGYISVRLYDASGNEKAYISANNGTADYKSPKLGKKKTYYIKVTAGYDKSGKYKLSVKDFKDDGADTKANSGSVSVNKAYNKAINVEGDVDWFKFKATGTKKHRIQVKNVNLDGYVDAVVYSSSGTELGYIYSNNGSTKYKDIKLTKGKTYYIKIDGSYTKSGKYTLTIKNPASVSVKKVAGVKAKAGSGNNKISWSKVSSVSGYEVYAKAPGSSSYKKVADVSSSKSSYTHKSLKHKKKYSYKVRAYKKVGSIKHYGSFSKVVSSTTK